MANNEPLGPGALIMVGVGVIGAAATMVWYSARPQVALIYGVIRSIELPFISSYLPFAEYFTVDSLRTGVVPAFSMIYINSLIYGILFLGLIFGVCFIALGRLDKYHIKRFAELRDPKGLEHGRSYEEVLERYAATQTDVQFFVDYKVLDLSNIYGVARQPMTALDFLIYCDGIKAVVVDTQSGHPPTLRLKEQKLREHYVNRLFGPRNPFMEIPQQRLNNVKDIESAVDGLRWDTAIVLYAAFLRFQGFYVEADAKGYETITNEVDAYISSVWAELNSLKKEFGDGIALGYNSAVHRKELEERYALSVEKKKDETRVYEPNVDLENISHFSRVQKAGLEDIETPYVPPELRERYAEAGAWKGKGGKKRKPDELLFVGEVMSIRAPNFACVAKAREGLKKILTRHLSGQTGLYPTGLDEKSRVVVYKNAIADGAEQAFNVDAQARLNDAAARMTKILFGHTWSFGVVGDALECVRESGIMPPNLFRFLRFCRETSSMWWFVQNLGAPSPFPENAALMEHYNAERATGMALLQPYIVSTMNGLKAEAEKYLVQETTDELIKLLGKGGLVDLVKARRAAERAALNLSRRMQAGADGKQGGIFSDAVYADDYLTKMETREQYNARKAEPSAAVEEGQQQRPPAALGSIDLMQVAKAAADQTGGHMMDVLREKILPRQMDMIKQREKHRQVAKEAMQAEQAEEKNKTGSV